jgi:hypothetical protein
MVYGFVDFSTLVDAVDIAVDGAIHKNTIYPIVYSVRSTLSDVVLIPFHVTWCWLFSLKKTKNRVGCCNTFRSNNLGQLVNLLEVLAIVGLGLPDRPFREGGSTTPIEPPVSNNWFCFWYNNYFLSWCWCSIIGSSTNNQLHLTFLQIKRT